MNLIDLHCDTFYRMKECSTKQNILQNQFHVDLEKLKKVRSYIQCFALFSDAHICVKNGIEPWTYILELYSLLKEELEKTNGLLEVARSIEEADAIKSRGHISALLTVEDGGIINNEMKRLDLLYKMGIRMLSLTWNYSNSLGHPNLQSTSHLGLTSFGFDTVGRMNELGMMIDVSHLSDKGFWDIIDASTKPILASHSNARAVIERNRNLDDKMIKALAEKGGIMGLNFCPYFLSSKSDVMVIDDLIKHLIHIRNVGGAEVMAIGTDFDGMNGELEIQHIGQMDKLTDALMKAGFSDLDIERLYYKNAKRLFKDVIG